MTINLTIPDAWFAGFLLGHPESTIDDAVNYWLDQEVMEAEFQAQQKSDYAVIAAMDQWDADFAASHEVGRAAEVVELYSIEDEDFALQTWCDDGGAQ